MSDNAAKLRHERHYTVAEANAERTWVAEQVDRVRDAIGGLNDPQAQAALEGLDPDSGGGYPGYEVATSAMQLLSALSELDAMDVVLRDVQTGLVDFPALRDGHEIYLCWLVDEDEVAYWHAPDAGFTGRRPLG